jgi:hypothetical protein
LNLKGKSYQRNKKTEKEKNLVDRTERLARPSRSLLHRIGAAGKGQRAPVAQATRPAPRPNKAGPARAPFVYFSLLFHYFF